MLRKLLLKTTTATTIKTTILPLLLCYIQLLTTLLFLVIIMTRNIRFLIRDTCTNTHVKNKNNNTVVNKRANELYSSINLYTYIQAHTHSHTYTYPYRLDKHCLQRMFTWVVYGKTLFNTHTHKEFCRCIMIWACYKQVHSWFFFAFEHYMLLLLMLL